MVGKTDFQFSAVGEDLEGNHIDFSTPLIFVPNSEMNNPANLSLIDSEVKKPSNSARRQARVPGQKVAFALSKGNDNTRLVTQSLNFINESAEAAGFFKPRLFKAEVRIPAVEQVVGSGAVSTLRLLEQYLQKGFGDAANLNKVFAELVQENSSGVLEKAQTAVRFAAEQAGGFATPNLDITNLSRKLGPLGGEVADALKDKFNPEQFFPKGLAKIFGAFDLADLIPKNTSTDQNAPKMQIRREGSTVIAELDWKPEVKAIDLVILKFTPTPNKTAFVVHGVFKKDLLAPSPQSMVLEGKLNDFSIELLKVVRVNFDKFSFKAQSGKKTDVNVALNEALPLEFLGDLEFVEGLRKIIPPGVFGDGVSIDLIKNPLGVKAGISIGLPPRSRRCGGRPRRTRGHR